MRGPTGRPGGLVCEVAALSLGQVWLRSEDEAMCRLWMSKGAWRMTVWGTRRLQPIECTLQRLHRDHHHGHLPFASSVPPCSLSLVLSWDSLHHGE